MATTGGSSLVANEVYTLGTSVVSASGFSQDIKEAPASISIIKKEDLQSKPYRDVAEAIADIPGVDLFASKGKTGAYNITMRGIEGYTLILIDGKRQSVGGEVGPNGFSAFQNSFLPPISAIERIEVIKGPMSTLYGSEALGGVVNIITKKVGEKWGTSIQTESMFQTNSKWGNTYGVSIYSSGPLIKDKLGLTLRAREFYREGSDIRYNTPDGISHQASYGVGPTRANNHNFGARLTYLIDDSNTLIYDFDYSQGIYNNKNGQIGTLTTPSKGGGLSGGYTDTMKTDKLITYLAHQGTYQNFVLDSSIQYNRVTNDGREVVGVATQPHLGENRDIKAEDFILDSRAVMPLGEKNMLSFGGEYRLEKMRDKIANPTKFDQYILGLYAEDEITLLENLNLTLGARYNYHETFGDNLSPRAYLVYNPTDTLTLKGGVSTGFKAPYANLLIPGAYNYGKQGKMPLYGNPNLKEETSINYELSAIHNADMYYVSVTGFLTDFKDKISSRSFNQNDNVPGVGICDSAFGCSQSVNHGEVRYMGVEFAAGITPYKNLNLDFSYTYLDSEIKKSDTQSLIGKPEEDSLKHNVIFKTSYKISDFTPFVKAQWQGKRYRGESYQEYYKDVFLMSVGSSYAINKDWQLNFVVNNLLDKDFTKDYVINSNGEYESRFNRIEEGRSVWISLVGNF
nr:TonB-dependent receptor [Helicobacter burdigaliensis]